MPQELHISSEFTIYNSRSEVPEKMNKLVDEALRACEKAYAPYSNFRVGAAIESVEGAIYTGNNQENAAYPSGLCAERVAVFSASATQPGLEIARVIVIAKNQDGIVAAPPCGACRQVLLEYEMQQELPIEVIFSHEAGQWLSAKSVHDLLPFTFTSKNLGE